MTSWFGGGRRPADASTDFVVLDFPSAFFIIPLAREERRFFVIRLRGKFFVLKICA